MGKAEFLDCRLAVPIARSAAYAQSVSPWGLPLNIDRIISEYTTDLSRYEQFTETRSWISKCLFAVSSAELRGRLNPLNTSDRRG